MFVTGLCRLIWWNYQFKFRRKRANEIKNDQIIPFKVQINTLKKDAACQLLKLYSKVPNYKKKNLKWNIWFWHTDYKTKKYNWYKKRKKESKGNDTFIAKGLQEFDKY